MERTMENEILWYEKMHQSEFEDMIFDALKKFHRIGTKKAVSMYNEMLGDIDIFDNVCKVAAGTYSARRYVVDKLANDSISLKMHSIADIYKMSRNVRDELQKLYEASNKKKGTILELSLCFDEYNDELIKYIVKSDGYRYVFDNINVVFEYSSIAQCCAVERRVVVKAEIA